MLEKGVMVAYKKAFGPVAAMAVALAFCTMAGDALVFSRPGSPPRQHGTDGAGLLVRTLPRG